MRMEINSNSQSSEDDVQILSSGCIESVNNSKNQTKSFKSFGKPSNSKSDGSLRKNLGENLVKRVMKSQLQNRINTKRKRAAEEEEDGFEYGAPYVVLAQDNEKPITCYMVPKKTDANVNQYIATSSQTLITSPNQNAPKMVLNQLRPPHQSQSSNLLQGGTKNNQDQVNSTPVIGSNDLSSPQVLTVNQNLQLKVNASGNQNPSLIPPLVATNFICCPVAPNSPKLESNTQKQVSVTLPSIKPKPNQIQITMIDPKAPPGSPQIITKTLTKVSSPFKSVGPSQEPTFPVRQVLPKIKKESSNSALLLETQKYLQDKIKSLKEELDVTKWQLNEQRKNTILLKTLEDKLIIKKRQIKTMCTQRKRLTKRLDNCREELEKTRKALELVESQAVLWNNSNMSELGKLIFSLHTVKNRKSLDSKSAANKAPPEVKGFVISLYMTSPKAYQLVRDCFNGLPHPKTVAKWLHGERVEDADLTPPVPCVVNEAALEETFTRVIETESQEVQQETEPTETGQFLTQHEIVNDDESPAVYYVLDEKGNVAGQLSSTDADIIFSADGFDLNSVPHHEVVIGE